MFGLKHEVWETKIKHFHIVCWPCVCVCVCGFRAGHDIKIINNLNQNIRTHTVNLKKKHPKHLFGCHQRKNTKKCPRVLNATTKTARIASWSSRICQRQIHRKSSWAAIRKVSRHRSTVHRQLADLVPAMSAWTQLNDPVREHHINTMDSDRSQCKNGSPLACCVLWI